MATWRCLNDMWIDCTQSDKWEKEAKEQRDMSPDPKIYIVLRCSLDPKTCGFVTKHKVPDNPIIGTREIVTNTTANEKKKAKKNTKDKVQYEQGSMF